MGLVSNLIAFVNVPNGRIGTTISGTVVLTSPGSLVVPVLDDTDDADVAAAGVPNTGGRVWTVELTPTRVGVINLTVQASATNGTTGERRVSVLVVGATDPVPAGGSDRFRRMLPSGTKAQFSQSQVVSTPDNGFWLACPT